MRKFFQILFMICITAMTTPLSYAETLSYVPKNPQTALIIIHGYGQSGERMQWMTDVLKKALPETAFYFPTAPDRAPVGGYQWFVIPVLGQELADINIYKRMLNDATENVAELHDLVDEIHEDLNMPYENIDVTGFSQGGLMALLTGLTNPNPLGRMVSLSGVPLLLTDNFTADMVVSTPQILLIQGTNDSVIPYDSLDMTKKTLTSLGLSSKVAVINGMRHEINQEALQHLTDFLQ